MTLKNVKRLVPPILSRLQEELGLQNWRIEVEYGDEEKQDEQGLISLADIRTNYERERATIRLYYRRFDSEKALESTLLHELFHIVLAPFDVLWQIYHAGTKKPSKEFLELFEIQSELGIRNLEKMYASIKRRSQRR